LFVWDRDTGNLASKPVGQVGKLWHLSDKEFDRIGLVSVRVEYHGEPVSAARVVLKDKAREQSQVLDESAKGEADFYVIQPGTITVSVEYRSGGSPAPTVVQQFPLDLERKTPDPLLTIDVPNAVATISPPATTATPSTPTSGKAGPAPQRSPIGLAIVDLVTLFIAALVILGMYHMAKRNPDWLKSKLAKAGVDVPEPNQGQDANAPIPDLIPVKPKAPDKIILDNAAPTTIVQPMATAHDDPRLVKSDGHVVALAAGETVVGRDDGLGVSLPGESSVSRRHASISLQNGRLIVKDLGSTNGTYVNGRRINAETPLSSGDDVQFGAVKFRVES
jgi:hypothetical protein